MNDSIIKGVRSDDAEWGSSPTPRIRRTKRKKSTIKWGQLFLALLFAGLAAFSAHMEYTAKSDIDAQRWAAGLIAFLALAVVAIFHDSKRRRPRGWHSKQG
jgi:hypothetical protein